ncbi:MAG TPA: hypothetical protein ENI49_02840 [Thermoplasmatales archaeon]|nr:hypothetical protein [Thermoplasmatales archaeon]
MVHHELVKKVFSHQKEKIVWGILERVGGMERLDPLTVIPAMSGSDGVHTKRGEEIQCQNAIDISLI